MSKRERKTIDVWVTRDSGKGEEPGLLMLHGKKPELNDGTWSSGLTCMVVPDVPEGKRKRLRLEISEGDV